ncbi:putative selenium-dependent hydroxylase accessory protein YqeC [Aeromonas veronii]|uniref:selenium cofactor biosynthesis protein YqeC n=1 Tax=Aeromonas veronii TaxID=654 RepID=UPI001F18A382|nr:selenium cofactor biosynthesis protein YqeC [Aeromonas veronii]MCF5726806.1 putative selenium-dependent hydroxylase accessory protein YqeC [Aeromonas veronii]
MSLPHVVAVAFPDIDTLLKPLTQNIDSHTTLISLCGAGGKTSTLFWLAEYFYQQGKRVLITTTTRMFLPAPSHYRELILEADPVRQLTRCQALPDGPTLVALFSHLDERTGKVAGPDLRQIDLLKGQQRFDLILVEADGAHHKLLKVPALHEPCIPHQSDWVIALVGGAMVGAKADPQQIHRWAALQALCGIEAGDPLDWALFHQLLSHPEGVFKGTPPGASRIWFINGDYQNEASWLAELIKLQSCHPEIHAIWQGAVRESPPIRHLICTAPHGEAL